MTQGILWHRNPLARPVVVVVSESRSLLERVNSLVDRLGGRGATLPKAFYDRAFARVLLAAGPGRRPVGAVIDMQAGLPHPAQLAEQLSKSGVPALLVVPAAREDVVRRATLGGTIIGVLTHGDGVGEELEDRVRRMLVAQR
ncbi:MAG: hypothetical protein HY816_19880 [Candidatus Wallbacteria bacterium]|nr:hypothetical protein [Candidatus Wallbacteria bacterium]